ncbi:MAG: hypothetical protein J0I06_12065 [Planctomycetes bacterium]|nr:hypothetical protein [Planctomycetota bacterium]
MAFFKAKVPVALATGVICLLVGGGLGAAIVSYSLGEPKPAAATGAAGGEEEGKGEPKAGGEGKGSGNKTGGGNKGAGGNKGGGGNKAGGGQRGPGPKVQLAQLVGKLDALTARSLHIELTPEEKKQTKELLAGLSEKDELTDDEAKAKLDALLKLLEGKKKTLEEAGYRWPGAPGGGGGTGGTGGGQPPNPFKAGEGADRLKSLQTTLG